eukprot:m.140541 g.140541  ORF g.140541 m.140541 type:complete len:226 (+) comp30123_c1_seq8:1161-1838(+)
MCHFIHLIETTVILPDSVMVSAHVTVTMMMMMCRPTSSGGGAGAKALKAALSAATSTTRGGRGGGGGRASRGRARGGRGRGVTAGKTQPTVVPAGRWKHDMFSGPRAKRGQMASANVVQRRRLAPAGPKIMNLKPKKRVAKAAPLTTGTVLRVTNLDDGVTASDMKELFESEGTLKKVVMTSTHCDITFQVKEDAVQAMQKFNGVTLDGEQMKIKLMSSLVLGGM